jgi:hypothetical protein
MPLFLKWQLTWLFPASWARVKGQRALHLIHRYLKKSRLLKFCYVPSTSLAFSKGKFVIATNSTNTQTSQVAHATNRSIFLRCLSNVYVNFLSNSNTLEKISIAKKLVDKMTVGKMPLEKLTVDKMSICQMLTMVNAWQLWPSGRQYPWMRLGWEPKPEISFAKKPPWSPWTDTPGDPG